MQGESGAGGDAHMDTSNCFYEEPLCNPGHRIACITSNVPGTWRFTRKEKEHAAFVDGKFPPVVRFRQEVALEGKAALTQAAQGVKMAEGSELGWPLRD